jgi:hypothetical protein
VPEVAGVELVERRNGDVRLLARRDVDPGITSARSAPSSARASKTPATSRTTASPATRQT